MHARGRAPLRWLGYLLLALRRFVSWKSSEAFIEWKFRTLLLWMQAIPLIAAVHWILDAHFVSLNRYVAATLVVLPLLVVNETVLSRYRPEKYARDFEALPRVLRVVLYTAAVLLVVLVFTLPFILHWLEFGHL